MKQIEKKKHSKGALATLLRNELAILPLANHPNIVKIIDVFSGPHYYYVVMELLEGGNLKSQISTSTMFSEMKVKNIVHQILSALNYLHLENIMHRDLKTENIMLEQSLYDCADHEVCAKITDFGMATYVDPTGGE
jgi:serine/threonine protein kinase